MAIDEQMRYEIHEWFRSQAADERAAAIMSLFPPVGWADVATRHDLDHLRESIEHRLDVVAAGLRGEMDRQLRRLTVWLTTVMVGSLTAVVGAMAAISFA